MKRAQKSMFTGLLLGAAVLVFVPTVYVSIANKLGKAVTIEPAVS